MAKKKITFMSDDLRMHSGIATQSKEFVIGTIHKYDWVQIGGAVKHPDNGKIVRYVTGIKMIWCKGCIFKVISNTSGYGNPDILRELWK